jgi:hypothetical protein
MPFGEVEPLAAGFLTAGMLDWIESRAVPRSLLVAWQASRASQRLAQRMISGGAVGSASRYLRGGVAGRAGRRDDRM